MLSSQNRYDVAIVGAGIIGLMIAYELSKIGYHVVIFEKNDKAGQGVTKNQSEVIHVIQLPFDSLKSRLAREGNRMYDQISQELGVKIVRLQAMLVVKSIFNLLPLFAGYLYLFFRLRKDFKVSLAGRKRLKMIEPSLSPGVIAGIVVDGYAIIDSQQLVNRMVETLLERGVEFRFNCKFISSSFDGTIFSIISSCGNYYAVFLVNSAGLYADDVAKGMGLRCSSIKPGLGVMAEVEMRINSIIAPFSIIQNERTKGGGIIPTTRGTVTIGPTLRLIDSKESYEINEEDIKTLLRKFSPLVTKMGEVKRVYAGIRPLSPYGDFEIISSHEGRGLTLLGIESPGLTAAPALAKLVVRRIQQLRA